MRLEDVIEKLEGEYERVHTQMYSPRNAQSNPWDKGYNVGYTDGLEAVLKLLAKVETRHKPLQAVKIRARLGMRELLEQGAEESAELGKAMLKLIRVMDDSKNPADMTAKEAQDNFYEEIRDILCVLLIILPEKEWEDLVDGVYTYYKLDRWLKRLDARGGGANEA